MTLQEIETILFEELVFNERLDEIEGEKEAAKLILASHLRSQIIMLENLKNNEDFDWYSLGNKINELNSQLNTLTNATLPGKEETKENLIFNEQSLRADIVKTWGEAGVHVEIFDRLFKLKQDAGTKEEKQTIFLVKDHNGVTYGAYRTKLKAESSITYCEDEYFIIEQELH